MSTHHKHLTYPPLLPHLCSPHTSTYMYYYHPSNSPLYIQVNLFPFFLPGSPLILSILQHGIQTTTCLTTSTSAPCFASSTRYPPSHFLTYYHLSSLIMPSLVRLQVAQNLHPMLRLFLIQIGVMP